MTTQTPDSASDEKYDLEITESPRNMPQGTTTGGVVTSEEYVTEKERQEKALSDYGYHKFRWSSLWSRAEVNPINGKLHPNRS